MYRIASALGAGPGSVLLITIGRLRTVLQKGLKALLQYDIFLRDRTAAEWLKDNSVVAAFRAPADQMRHVEAHEFWTRLSDSDKKALLTEWQKLVQDGGDLLGDARYGGVGQGYGPSETAPPARSAKVLAWGKLVQAFLQKFEEKRAEKRVEARTNPHPSWDHFVDGLGSLKTIGWAFAIGMAGVLLVGAWSALEHRP